MLKSRLAYSIIFFLMCVALFWVTKPSFAFDESGRPRPFGFGEDRTLFTVGVVTVAASILTFYVFTLIDVIYGSSSAGKQTSPLPPARYTQPPPQQQQQVLRAGAWQQPQPQYPGNFAYVPQFQPNLPYPL